MKDLDWPATGRNYSPVREGNPNVLVLGKQLLANGPILGFISPPIRMNLPGNFRRQPFG
jgi:hypothetical protein